MNSNWFKILMRLMKIRVGKRVLLKGVPIIVNKPGAKMEIGDDVTIKSSVLSNMVGLYSRTIIVTRLNNSKIVIGNHVGMSGVTIYARKEISIGEGTLIGGNTKIFDNDFHPIDAEARSENNTEMIGTRAVHIGQNCFIGCNALILKGTELGNNCVVGAGAVVSGKFPEKSVIAGNPAKVIRML